MGTGAEKFVREERVRTSIFKHRGDLNKVSEETETPLEMVKKIYDKMRRKQRHDVSFDVASHISEAILVSYEEQMARLRQILSELMDEREDPVSPCCQADVKVNFWEEAVHYNCQMCGKELGRPKIPPKNYPEIRRILGEMRNLQDSLADFSVKMGFTKKEEGSPRTQTNVFIGNGGQQGRGNKRVVAEQVSSEDAEVLGEVQKLDGPGRDRFIKQLEAMIVEDGDEEDKPRTDDPS